MTRTLIKNATLVTMDPALGDIHDGDILIDGATIAEVGRNINAADAAIVDGRGRIVTPGLVKAGILSAKASSLAGATSPWHFLTLLFSGRASFIAALFAGLFLGTLCCGFLADRFGRRAVFTYSLLWYSTANAIMAGVGGRWSP